MKKFMIVLAAAVMMASTVKAEDANMKSRETAQNAISTDSVNFRFRIHFQEMNEAMHLEEGQMEQIQFINRLLSHRIGNLVNIPEENRRSMLAAIVSDNLSAIRKVVTGTQYHIYLTLLNQEINKAGLNSILYAEDLKS